MKIYRDDPKPTYEPQKKSANKPMATVPTTVPINHKGIRPVVPVLDMLKKEKNCFRKIKNVNFCHLFKISK